MLAEQYATCDVVALMHWCHSNSLDFNTADLISNSMSKYVGLENPDSICYLNSAIQQLFMIPSFRNSILSLPKQIVSKGSRAVSLKEGFLSELYSLFVALENGRISAESGLSTIDPLPFCRTIWNPLGVSDDSEHMGNDNNSGGYIDPTTQMDVSEFLSSFFAQLHSFLAAGAVRHPLLHTGQSICGEICNELYIDFEKCSVNSDNFSGCRILNREQFYFLSVRVGALRPAPPSSSSSSSSSSSCSCSSTRPDGSAPGGSTEEREREKVRVISSLREALGDFSAENSIDAYWNTSDRTEKGIGIGTSKKKMLLPSLSCSSLSASSLPPHVIIHLKRFRFDFSKMEQVKVDTRFEYPLNLDLWPHTREGMSERRADMEWERNMREGGEETASSADADLCGVDQAVLKRESKYVLGGVIVHVGTATDGHYFSLVKVRENEVAEEMEEEGGTRTKQGSAFATATDESEGMRAGGGKRRGPSRWLRMNDSEVTEFDIRDLERETFGGQTRGPLKHQSAFMVVYDRVCG